MSSVLIVICFVFFLLIAFKKQVSFIFQFMFRAVAGLTLFSVVNSVASATVIGVNMLSLIVVGFLGLPGVILLFLTNLIL